MALIKSKQIQSLDAVKIVETAEKRFVSDVEKASWSDKYTKAEIDTTVSQIQNDIQTLQNDITNNINTQISNLDTELESVNTTLTTQINNLDSELDTVNATLTTQINTVQTTLQNQINAAIQGLTWKAPVDTFADIATVYPTPLEGWMVTVRDTNKVYRFDGETASWVEFPIQVPTQYNKTIVLTPSTNGQTVINTGIRTDNTGIYKAANTDIVLAINGFIQIPGADYTVATVNNEIVVTWLNRNFELDPTDEIAITYNHFDIV